MKLRKPSALLFALILAGGCASGIDDLEQGGSTSLGLEPGEECLVNEESVEHSCLHANFGPFASVTAQPYPGSVVTNINSPHTAYTIALPESDGSHHGAVLYRPVVSGEFAFFTTPGVPIALYASGGTEVPLEREGAIDPNLCAQLEQVSVFHLDPAETYTVVYGPGPASSVQAIVEYLGEGGCESCEHVELSASRSLFPPQNSIGEAVLSHPITFEIPETLGITQGSACVGSVKFSFSHAGGPEVRCLYFARPQHSDFKLLACNNGYRAGDDAEADSFKLQVNPVAALQGFISVELTLEDEACHDHHD